MISALVRKVGKVAGDPILRKWLVGCVLGRYRRPAGFVSHHPSYLRTMTLVWTDLSADTAHIAGAMLSVGAPTDACAISLAGHNVRLSPERPDEIFDVAFDDTEQLLALHRFAWLPLLGDGADPAWTDCLWRSWVRRYGVPDDGWAWHPYTAAERVINILDFARRAGWPGDKEKTLVVLARHAAAIAARLEYYGDHDTSNHLSNNGRGLYRLGLALGLDDAADMGRDILLAEAQRIFMPSGVLREGSSHYHLLLTRNYIDAWLAARRHARPETDRLRDIAVRALGVLPRFVLPGRFPLIGDISPDCPPEFLCGLLPDADMSNGWSGLLDMQDCDLVAGLKRAAAVPRDDAGGDGWFDVRLGAWSAVLHVAPQGWQQMPGHGHQDTASAEIHFGATPIFVDPGRGAYGETGEAAFYTSGAAHNGLTIDGNDPYPPNKPYYGVDFRRAICGAPPRVARSDAGLRIEHGGFSRLAGIGNAIREFHFSGDELVIYDRIDGRRTAQVTRRLFSPWPVTLDGATAFIDTPAGRFRLDADVGLRCERTKYWPAYGVAADANLIIAVSSPRLPTALRLTVRKMVPA